MDNRHILEAKKKQIEDALAGLFGDVVDSLDQAVKCMVKMDVAVCEALIRGDVALNEKRRQVEQDSLVAIASQQPMASDLRDIIADMRMASELERMGDYAVDIASSVLELDQTGIDADWLLTIQRMSSLAQEMLHHAMRAHQTDDATLARRVGASDDTLDGLLAGLVDTLMQAMQADPAKVQNASRVLWIAHNLERYGDRATNIAEQVIFRVEGEVVDLD